MTIPQGRTYDQSFYGNGKILLSGEYFILDGALGLALPTKFGQSMKVRYTPSFNPLLTWHSYNTEGEIWLKANFEFWHFDCLDPSPPSEVLYLQKILRAARDQNQHFLREGGEVIVETRINFPYEWGLGSSSTLIHNIAQWARISAFDLGLQVSKGSGYDIACAQSDGPILYQKKGHTPKWEVVKFDPPFKDQLYFVHQKRKKNTGEAIADYDKKRPFPSTLLDEVSHLSKAALAASTLEEFNAFLFQHEKIVSDHLHLPRLKDRFPDFWGEIKSLGAWGGDFALATSDRSSTETLAYFQSLGHSVVLRFDDLFEGPVLVH